MASVCTVIDAKDRTIMDWWREYSDNGDTFKNYTNLFVIAIWDQQEIENMLSQIIQARFREQKLDKRDEKYLLKSEEERFSARIKIRSSATIRFGNFKSGTNDFCLVGGAWHKGGRKFFLYYRSVELTLEFFFDMLFLAKIFKRCELDIRTISIFFPRAFTSSRDGRLSYYHELKGILAGKGRTRKTVVRKK